MKSKQLQRYEKYLKEKKGDSKYVYWTDDHCKMSSINLLEYPQFRDKNRPKLIGLMEK